MRIRVTGLPRPNDPEAQRRLWLGLELTVIPPDPDDEMQTVTSKYLWVSYEEVIRLLNTKDPQYSDFFRRLRKTPGGSRAPGLLIERAACEEI